MPIFGPDKQDTEERKKRNRRLREEMGEVPGPKEQGAEELDLEDIVPGGSYLSMATPVGLGKKLLRKAGGKLAKEAAEVGEKKVAREGYGLLERLAEKGAPEKAVDYGSMKAARVAERKAAEEAAPVINYTKMEGEELAKKEAKKKKIKPTAFEYADGRTPIEKK